jgi:hypothetical protein
MLELMSRREARELGRSAWHVSRRFFYAWPSVRMTTTGLPSSCMHVIRCQVPGAGRLPIPEREEHIAGLRHLEVAAHTGGFSKALPVGTEEPMSDGVLPGPAVAELFGTSLSAREDLGDAIPLWRQRLAQALVIGERARTGDDQPHDASLFVMRPCGWLPGTTLRIATARDRCGGAPRPQGRWRADTGWFYTSPFSTIPSTAS